MYGFEESEATRQLELTKIKTENGTFFVIIKSVDLFRMDDHEKVANGFDCNRTLKRNNNNDCIIRTAGVGAAKKAIKCGGWYIPH